MNKINTVAVDMDGVLTNLDKSIYKIFNKPYNPDDLLNVIPYYSYTPIFNLTQKEIWKKVEEFGIEFWADLEPYEYAMNFWNQLKDLKYHNAIKELIILTSSSASSKWCASGKIVWIKKWLGEDFDDYIICKNKYHLANRRTILIDDFERNINKFNENNGIGILFPRQWNEGRTSVIANQIEGLPEHQSYLDVLKQVYGLALFS